MKEEGFFSEMFGSIQGEGIYAGVKQVFLRFGGCNLKCSYCDTPGSIRRSPYCTVYAPAGKKRFKNPLSVTQAVSQARSLCRGGHISTFHSVSLTGGEPLLQADYLCRLIPRLRKLGLGIYLETNGTLPEELSAIVEGVGFIAMDIKPPSITGKDMWGTCRQFLKAGAGKIFVKFVVDKKTTGAEIEKAACLIAEVNSKIPLVLQPVSGGSLCGPDKEKIIRFHGLAMKTCKDVRVIPQLHKILGFI